MKRPLVTIGLAVMLVLPLVQDLRAQEALAPSASTSASTPTSTTADVVNAPTTQASPQSSVQPAQLPAQLPLIRSTPDTGSPSSWLAGWLFVGVLVLVAGFMVRRRAIPALMNRWKLAARAGVHLGVVPLSSHTLRPGVSVHVVRWQGEDLLLGCTARQVSLLARKPAPDDGENDATGGSP